MQRIHPRLSEIRASLPEEKNRGDSFWTRLVLRPLSLPATWVLVRLGFTANGVSYLSALICILAGILLVIPDLTWMLTGALLFNLFAVLDCADGNVARVRGKGNPYGEWADALGGYTAYSVVLFCAGIAAEAMPIGRDSFINFTIVGSLGALCNLQMRVVHQNFKNASFRIDGEKRKTEDENRASLQKFVSENLGITGLLMPAVLIGVFTGSLPWIIAAYALFYAVSCLIILFRLILRVARYNA